MIISSLFALFFTVLILALGMDFAKKIGARLLLLRGDYDFKNDILKPACITGIIVSAIVIIINMIMPLTDPIYSFFPVESTQQFILRMLSNLFSVISYNISFLLVWVCGLGLLIRSIFKNTPTNTIMYISIVMMAFLRHLLSMLIRFMSIAILYIEPQMQIASTPIVSIDPIIRFGIDVVLGILFWKKGFETAVLCHLIIVFIVQMATLVMHFLH